MSNGKGQPEPSMEEILASIRRIISEDEPGVEAVPLDEPPPDVQDTPAEPAEADDVLDLTDMVDDQATVVPPAPPMREAPPLRAVPYEPERRPVRPVEHDDDGLVSAATAAATRDVLGRLGDAGLPPRVGIGDGSKTLEDIVRELLRPMLRDWLDANLPTVVEQVVEREIQRLGRRP